MRKSILVALLSVASVRADVTRLEALGQIETGNDDRAVGGAGEVSRYQIKPWIWRRYSDSEAYGNRRISTQVAEEHLAGLAEIFRKRTRREPDDFDLYVLWNAGPTYYGRIGFASARVHPIIRERARRYANLRQALEARLRPARPVSAAANSQLLKPDAAPISPPFRRETLPLFLPPAQTVGVQHPMFSLLPLLSEPQSPLPGQQPLFAIGGVPVE